MYMAVCRYIRRSWSAGLLRARILILELSNYLARAHPDRVFVSYSAL